MTDSNSGNSVQTIGPCELCYEENIIQWKCIHCEKYLCIDCTFRHLRDSEKAIYQPVNTESPTQDVQRTIVTDNIPCEHHVTKINCMFCESCDTLVCPDCMSTCHQEHHFIQIDTALYDKLEQLKEIKKQVMNKLCYCNEKNRAIENKMSKFNAIFDESVGKIKQKEHELLESEHERREEISKYSKVLQNHFEGQRLKVITMITKIEQQVKEARKKQEELKEKLEVALASKQGHVIFKASLTKPVMTFGPLPFKVEIFIPLTIKTKNVQSLFGSIQEVKFPIVRSEFGFEILRTFPTHLPIIQKVIPLDESSAWIFSKVDMKSVIERIDIKDNDIITLKEICLHIYDMALTSDNCILFTEFDHSDVMLLTNSGEIKSFVTLAPLLPKGIHVTYDNKVLIGVKEPEYRYTTTDQSKRAVMEFNMNGKQNGLYQYDRNNKRLFTFPNRITTNNKQDIIAIEETSTRSGRVVTLDREGNLKWIYQGTPTINRFIRFHPRGIITTSTDSVVVSDYRTHTLHILSEKGDVLTCKLMNHIRINFPLGLNIDRGGRFWLTCGTGGQDSRAQIHIINLLHNQAEHSM